MDARRTAEPQVATLGTFLRSRRARLRPEDVGLVHHGRRRVPGLRREELAMLAGVSITYYTRLEQGQASNASRSIVEALARALRLDEDEAQHLRALAAPAPPARRAATPERLRDGLARAVAGFTTPAMVLGRHNDILAWNPSGHRVFAGHLDPGAPERVDQRPNQSRLLFLDPHVRSLYREWDQEAELAVASLRFLAAQHRDDAGVAALIGELSIASEAFAALWAAHPVQRCTTGTKRLDHPEVGAIDLDYEVLHAPGRRAADAAVHRHARQPLRAGPGAARSLTCSARARGQARQRRR